MDGTGIPMSAEVAREEAAVILLEIVKVYAKTLEEEGMWQASAAVRGLGMTAAAAIRKRDTDWLPQNFG